jgi:superfamily I DNA/RNA helicase/DNA polymerase III epsilon subunit-like protein
VTPTAVGAAAAHSARTPSASQLRAIEAEPGPILLRAGPGAGKTFCLTERIRFLIEHHGVDPKRICAFTFTNKAAGEIATRLAERLGGRADAITRGTIHAFCATLLRQRGGAVGLEPGFGIADEEYQLSVLRRLDGPRKWHRQVLTRFAGHRFRGDPLQHDDLLLFRRYEDFLATRNVVDFDALVIKTAQLLDREADAAELRARWDVILVDEFQDLNPVQYRIVRALSRDHRHVFAVGDHEQSIYSWAGADPRVFHEFTNDFTVIPMHLEENNRCPRQVFDLARSLVDVNPQLGLERFVPRTQRESGFPVRAMTFTSDDEECGWLVDDVRSDRVMAGHRWGDVAVLYRKHEIGNRLESAFLNAGIPCRLAHGRALTDDPAIAYVIAAVRVIESPHDDICRDEFFRLVLNRTLFEEAQATAQADRRDLRRHLADLQRRLPRADPRGRQIRRALANWKNLTAVGRQHSTLASLIGELLSRRVGRLRTVLDEQDDLSLSDPASNAEVASLAARLTAARDARRPIWIPALGGVDIALKGMLLAAGFPDVRRGGEPPPDGEWLSIDDVPSLGLSLGVFKACQLLEAADGSTSLANFTAVDLETTSNDVTSTEVIEIAAVRVRDGRIVEQWSSLVRPTAAISPGATATHGLTWADVSDAPTFAEVWPTFRAFCGDDVTVAHNGYDFDFRILARLAKQAGARFDLITYDTLPLARDLVSTSRKLESLAAQFGIDAGRSHRALDDTRALALVVLALHELKQRRARKTGLVTLLDNLGIALALAGPSDIAEARLFADMCRPFALGRYSGCLEAYEREQGDDASIPTVDEVIEALGGPRLMERIRAEKTAEQRYPEAMARLRRIVAEIPEGTLGEQLVTFLERAVLSAWDGLQPDRARVNLLTLHSTKGLEFSRVYVVGAEDAQLPGGSPKTGPTPHEIEEARRLLYVGMTRTIDRLTLTRAETRRDKPTGGHRFLDEMRLTLTLP